MKKIIASPKYRLNWYKIVLFSVTLVLTGINSITVKGQTVVPLKVNASVSAADEESSVVTSVSANTGTTTGSGTITISGTGVADKSLTGTQASHVVNLGNTDVYSLISTSPNRQAQSVTFGESGEIESISIYHNGGTGNIVLGVYSDQAGAPSALSGVTALVPINANEGWQTVSLISPVTVALGQTVWLSWVFENNPGIRYVAGTPARAQSSALWAAGMPETFGGALFADYKYSVYCSYLPVNTTSTLSVSPENISIGHNDNYGFVKLESNTSWSVSDDANWLEVRPESGSNYAIRGSITAYILFFPNSDNTGTRPRTATVTISGAGAADKTITFTQECQGNAAPPTYDVYDLTSTSEYLTAQPVTFNEAGEIEDISIYHNGGTGNILVGVYSDQDYSPSSLLGVSDPTSIYSGEGWQRILFKNPVKVNWGQTVWLSWIFENNPGVRYIAGGPATAVSTSGWTEGMPITFQNTVFTDVKYSIYCGFNAAVKTFNLSSTNISLGYDSGSIGTFNVISNTNWGYNIDNMANEWLDALPPVIGSNNGTITLTTRSINTGTCPRTATLSFGSEIVTVTQEIYQKNTAKILGIQDIYGFTSTTEYRKAQPVTFNESGLIESVTIYHNGGTGNLLIGVYSDQAGSPSSLLGVSESTPVNTTAGWQTVSLIKSLKVFPGQKVWLSWVFENNPGIRYRTGSHTSAESAATWSGGMPAIYGNNSFTDFNYSVYCTYKQPPYLNVSNISFDCHEGSMRELLIKSNTSWNITNNESWIDVSELSGSNDGSVVLTVKTANTGTSPRTATITIVGSGVEEKTIMVTQDYPGHASQGNTLVYDSTSKSEYLTAQPITFEMPGEIEEICIYHHRGTGNVLIGVYSDQEGSPATLLGVSDPTPINTFEGWQCILLKNPVKVNLGQTVWLSWIFENNPGVRYTTEAPAAAKSTSKWSDGMPNTFGITANEDFKYSIFCDYKEVARILNISPEYISLGYDSGSKATFDIISNTKWWIYGTQDWFVFSSKEGSGNATITVTANSARMDTIPRHGQFIIQGYGLRKEYISVIQDAAPLVTTTGNITYQVWNNIGNSPTVSSLTSNTNYPNNPTSSKLITSMEGTTDLGDSYGARIVGYIWAPATGSYTFWIASDDYGELWLSTNDDPANKHKIAYVNGYTWIREWNKYATQKSATINLVQGQKYYIEALMKEATGHDNLAVGWLKPKESGTVPSEIIPGSVLSPYGTILVSSVTLPPTLDLNTGASVLLPATVLPANATVKTLNWTTSDPTVALVNSNGILTGISIGSATISATSTDGSNKSGTCVVTVEGVPTICSATGNINYQVWNNIGSSALVSSLTGNADYPDNPTSSTLIYSMEGTAELGNGYGARIAGYICAPATGSYTFWIASDDNGELWLSTNDDPVNKYKIAYVNGYTSTRDWNKYATQKSATINLVQGQKYYIEALMKESTGHDNLAVGWLKPGESGMVPSEIIPGYVLSPYGIIQVSSVTLPATLDLNTGASVLLPATMLPANATVISLNWTTSDPSVALVNNIGIVTAISSGIATISATSTDGSNKSGTCLVTVSGVPTMCSALGNITYQVWNTIGSSTLVSSLTSNFNYPNNPTSSTLINAMEGTTDLGNSYGARIAGYICAPATGNYTFWIASDDYGELWLSTNDEPAYKHKIAYVNGYTWIRDWNKYATQKSVTINLVQEQKYYIEALMKEGTGHDNLAVGWLKPGQSGTVPSEVIPGAVLSPLILNGKINEAKDQDNTKSNLDVTLLVYPNPLKDNLLNIKLGNHSAEATLRIFTVSGVKCYEEIIQNSGIIQVDRSVFKSGIYIIKVENEDFVKITKLIVN